jgi:predicted O-methyltransferase YrrM
MLQSTREKLQQLYAGGQQLGTDGQFHSIDTQTLTSQIQGDKIASIHRSLRPSLSIEIGLAYGFSTLYILDAMHEGGYGRHIAVDPMAESFWHGIGLQAIKDADLEGRFKWIRESSSDALPMLIRSKEKAQFIFIDGAHHFDYAFVDFFLSDRLLDQGGMILLDDMWMPSVQKVVSYVSRNFQWYERIDVQHDNIAVFRKAGQDTRAWDHFEDF